MEIQPASLQILSIPSKTPSCAPRGIPKDARVTARVYSKGFVYVHYLTPKRGTPKMRKVRA